jgi:ferredoxin
MTRLDLETPQGLEVVAYAPGTPLLDLAETQDLPIPFGCQSGKCGVCQVKVISGELAEAGAFEAAVLDGFGCDPDVRLACQAVMGEGRVRLRVINV